MRIWSCKIIEFGFNFSSIFWAKFSIFRRWKCRNKLWIFWIIPLIKMGFCDKKWWICEDTEVVVLNHVIKGINGTKYRDFQEQFVNLWGSRFKVQGWWYRSWKKGHKTNANSTFVLMDRIRLATWICGVQERVQYQSVNQSQKSEKM